MKNDFDHITVDLKNKHDCVSMATDENYLLLPRQHKTTCSFCLYFCRRVFFFILLSSNKRQVQLFYAIEACDYFSGKLIHINSVFLLNILVQCFVKFNAWNFKCFIVRYFL